MNVKMWGPILLGTVIEAVSIIMLTGYSFTLLAPDSSSFGFSPNGTDYAGLALSIIGLILIMIGGIMKK